MVGPSANRAAHRLIVSTRRTQASARLVPARGYALHEKLWRRNQHHAEEARVIAEQMQDSECRRMMADIALDYDKMAAALEKTTLCVRGSPC
jgi:hypothetical protein